jgi:drug/metabolite transporter (DMT)-like permease
MSNQTTTSMTETSEHSRRLGRSLVALLVGFVAVVVLSLGTDLLLRKLKVFPPLSQPMSNALFLLATIYRAVYGIVGSYITARLAPNRPMQHALVGGGVGLVLSIVGAVATWNQTALGPHWYPLALVVTAMPCAWAGGALRVTQLRERTGG